MSYVGRPSKYGNPYPISKTCSREQAIKYYGMWLGSSGITVEDIKKDLKGKDLICWCAPEPCHADILLEIANEEEDVLGDH